MNSWLATRFRIADTSELGIGILSNIETSLWRKSSMFSGSDKNLFAKVFAKIEIAVDLEIPAEQ